jgi:hypothetical protein
VSSPAYVPRVLKVIGSEAMEVAKMKRVKLSIGLAGLLAAAAAAAALAVPAASRNAIETRANLHAYVVASNPGPLTPCSGSDCTAANVVQHLIYVVNGSSLINWNGFTTRATVPNAFAVSSVDESVFVNGVHVPEFDSTFTPPPNPSILSWSGHWPATVTCEGQPGSFQTPCDVVSSPAVIPGENTVVLYAGWAHGTTEPNGTYVFKFTVHGSLNGTSLDLSASSPPIQMTP